MIKVWVLIITIKIGFGNTEGLFSTSIVTDSKKTCFEYAKKFNTDEIFNASCIEGYSNPEQLKSNMEKLPALRRT